MALMIDDSHHFTPISNCFEKIDSLTSSLQLENNAPHPSFEGLYVEIECCSRGQMAHQQM